MKHLLLILSLSLMGSIAFAGGADMSTNCPYNTADRFALSQKPVAIDDQKAARTRAAKKAKQGQGTNSN